jgi:predicted  nucleic acid-binding Zn-ribbon protein
MARTRSANAGFWWAIVVLATGTVVFGLLAVVFYTQLGSATREADSAQRALREYVTQAQETSSALAEVRQLEGDSVVGKFINQADSLRAQVSTLTDQNRNLNAGLSQEQSRREAVENQLKEAQNRVAAAQQEVQKARQAYQNQVAALQSNVSKADSALGSVTGLIESETARLQEELTKVRNDAQSRINSLEGELTTARRDVTDLSRQVAELNADRSRAVAAVARPDARVISVLDHSNRVTLDLGRNQRVPLGMTFEVYSPDTLLKLADNADAPGKATVEVYELFDNTSTARVVRKDSGARLDSGDAAVNLVFDKDRTFKFVVFGDFDLAGGGEPTPADRERVASLVQQWGGQVSDELSFGVDYVVVGVEPEAPEQLSPADAANPVKIKEFNEQQERYNAYQATVARAQELNIPVLNQNRFLDLIGYYER